MTAVPRNRGEDAEGKAHVTTEAETRVTHPQPRRAKDGRQPARTRRQGTPLPRSLSREQGPLMCGLGTPALRIMKRIDFCGLQPPSLWQLDTAATGNGHGSHGERTRQPWGTDTAALLPSLHSEHFRFSLRPPWAPGPPPLALRLGIVAASTSHCSVLISLPGDPALSAHSVLHPPPAGRRLLRLVSAQSPSPPHPSCAPHATSTLIQPGCPHHRPLSPVAPFVLPHAGSLPQATRTTSDLRLASVVKSRTGSVGLETGPLGNLQGLQVATGTTLNKTPPPTPAFLRKHQRKGKRKLMGKAVFFGNVRIKVRPNQKSKRRNYVKSLQARRTLDSQRTD